jgi:hypothetical protein
MAANCSHPILRKRNSGLRGSFNNVVERDGRTYGVEANDGPHEVTFGIVYAVSKKCFV